MNTTTYLVLPYQSKTTFGAHYQTFYRHLGFDIVRHDTDSACLSDGKLHLLFSDNLACNLLIYKPDGTPDLVYYKSPDNDCIAVSADIKYAMPTTILQAADTNAIGDFVEYALCCTNLEATLTFFQGLDFEKVWHHQDCRSHFSLLQKGNFILGLHEKASEKQCIVYKNKAAAAIINNLKTQGIYASNDIHIGNPYTIIAPPDSKHIPFLVGRNHAFSMLYSHLEAWV